MTIHKKRLMLYIVAYFFAFDFFVALQANSTSPENSDPLNTTQEINDLFTTTLNQDFEKNAPEMLEEKKQATSCENLEPDQNTIEEVLEKLKKNTDASFFENLILQIVQEPQLTHHFLNKNFNDNHYDDIAHHITQIIETDTNPKLKEHIFKQLGNTITTDTQFTHTLVRTHLKDFIAAIIQNHPTDVIEAFETVLKNDTKKNTYLSMTSNNLNRLPEDKKTKLFQEIFEKNPAIIDSIFSQIIQNGRLNQYKKTTEALVFKVKENTDATIKNKIIPEAEKTLVNNHSSGLFIKEFSKVSQSYHFNKNLEKVLFVSGVVCGAVGTVMFYVFLGRYGITLLPRPQTDTK